jgi:hypothetical protein
MNRSSAGSCAGVMRGSRRNSFPIAAIAEATSRRSSCARRNFAVRSIAS